MTTLVAERTLFLLAMDMGAGLFCNTLRSSELCLSSLSPPNNESAAAKMIFSAACLLRRVGLDNQQIVRAARQVQTHFLCVYHTREAW
jgi:hypothetical protein